MTEVVSREAQQQRAQQLADLGIKRRDELSTMEGGRQDRNAWRHEMNAIEAARAHRAKARSGPDDNERAKMLKAWNTEETFGDGDAVNAALPNHYDGQGHRERLANELQHRQSRFEDAEDRPTPNYRHDGTGRDPRGRDVVPRDFSLQPLPPRDPNRHRAESPRAAGRVRFVNGQRFVGGKLDATPPAPPAQAVPRPMAVSRPSAVPRPAATPRALLVNLPTTPREAQSRTRPAAAPAVSASSRPVDRPSTPQTRATAPAANAAPAMPSPAPLSAVEMDRMQMKAKAHEMLALVYAACPNAQSEKYYSMNPNQVHVLEAAREQLATEAVRFAVGSSDAETQQHYQSYPDRRWIFQAAVRILTGAVGEPSSDVYKVPMLFAVNQAVIAQKKKAAAAAVAAISDPSQQAQPVEAHFIAQAPVTTQPSVTTPSPVTTSVPVTVAPALQAMVNEQADRVEVAAASRSTVQPRSTTPQTTTTANNTAGRSGSTAPSLAPTPATSAPVGRLNVSFTDPSGGVLGTSSHSLSIPVIASLSIVSTQGHFNPLQLAANMGHFARSMQARSMGTFHQTNDGLWEDAD